MKNIKLQFKLILNSSSGQALVTLLFFTIIGMTIITSAAVFVYENSQSASVTEQGTYAYYIAESGIEEALLRLLRDPGYSGTSNGQPFSVGEGSVTIDVISGTITATGIYQSVVRKIQAQTVYNNYIFTISSWKEIQ
jgi:hypothetical protein